MGAGKEPEIFHYRKIAVEAETLGNVTKSGANQVPFSPHIRIDDCSRASRWSRQTAQHAHGGGFPGAVSAQKAKNCPRMNIEREGANCLEIAKALAQGAQGYYRVLHRPCIATTDKDLQPAVCRLEIGT